MSSGTNFKSVRTIDPQFGQGSYRGIVNDTNPSRLYRIRINQRSSLNLNLSGLKTNANLTLLNGTGSVIGRSARPGQSNESIAQVVEPGTYYVRVNRQQGMTRYQLSMALASDPEPISTTSGNSLADQVVALVNAQRSQAGLKPVRLNPLLSAAAQTHSQDMALNDFFSHTGSDGSTADRRILTAGYNYSVIGENIAVGYATPADVVQAWMDSPEHRDNILHPMLEDIGIGFYFLDNDTGQTNYHYYWTQDFGRPLDSL
jgi:uncharacterized protein YkwD